MAFLAIIERVVFGWSRTRFLLLIAFAMLIKTGIWHIPNLFGVRPLAENPFVNPFANPIDSYVMTSYLAPFGAWLIGARAEVPFLLYHAAFSLSFSALFIWQAFSRLEDANARAAIVLFTVLPVSATAYYWIGNDGLTLLLMLAILALRERAVAAAVLAWLLGMQHFEQAIFGFAGLSIASALTPRFGGKPVLPWRSSLAILAGIVVGKLTLMILFSVAGIVVASRLDWLRDNLAVLLGQFWYHSQYVVWSVLGLGWLIALRFADRGRAAIPFFVCFFALLCLLLVSGDQTRVLAIITFPLVYAFWLSEPEFIASLPRSQIAGLFLLWLLVPWAWVWGGVPTWSVLPYDLAYLAHRLFGWLELPANVPEWPFGRVN